MNEKTSRDIMEHLKKRAIRTAKQTYANASLTDLSVTRSTDDTGFWVCANFVLLVKDPVEGE